jgi:nucleotide-binding universal stress UspA family protein
VASDSPAVLAPRRPRLPLTFSRIAVCLSPNVAPARAVGIACAFTPEKSGRLFAIAAIEVALDLPLETPHAAAEERARDAIQAAQAIAASHRVPVEGVVLRARDAGEAIVAEIVLQRIDLVVITEQPRGRRGSCQLSRTTENVLKQAPCRVLLIGGAGTAVRERPTSESEPRFRSDRPSDAWPGGDFVDRIDLHPRGLDRT